MRAQLHTWIIFGVCLALVLGALGWISLTVLRLDQREAEARRTAARDENVRLARWRLEAQLAVWRQMATARLLAPGGPEADPGADPNAGLLADALPAWRFFQRGSEPLRVVTPADDSSPEATTQLQATLQANLQATLTPAVLANWRADRDDIDSPPHLHASATLSASEAAAVGETDSVEEQPLRNHLEASAVQRFVATAPWAPGVATVVPPGTRLHVTWLGPHLLLWRHDPVADVIDGYWLDTDTITRTLAAEIRDLLPRARLVAPDSASLDHVDLAALPLALEPGEPAFYFQRPTSPTRLMLLIAWSGMLLPAVGVAILLVSMASLSARRAAFVAAVTHELRTPLTTFRMYTDMLVAGMVPPDRQATYLQTLQREAHRLNHLVDNVLTYARLERGRAREAALETLPLAHLVDRIRTPLAERAGRAAMELDVAPSAADGDTLVRVDPAAVERILVNLVDNACKYAGDAPGTTDQRIHLELAADAASGIIRVRDHGPGVADVRHLFKPFHQFGGEAARQQPGIGLGLALSLRLARRMGGDLRREPVTGGASFALHLPRELL